MDFSPLNILKSRFMDPNYLPLFWTLQSVYDVFIVVASWLWQGFSPDESKTCKAIQFSPDGTSLGRQKHASTGVDNRTSNKFHLH
jgi:hypothetical protein